MSVMRPMTPAHRSRPTKRRRRTQAEIMELKDTIIELLHEESVEVDAIRASTLRQICEEEIERHVDHHQLDATRRIERSEREVLASIASGLDGWAPTNGGAE